MGHEGGERKMRWGGWKKYSRRKEVKGCENKLIKGRAVEVHSEECGGKRNSQAFSNLTGTT